MRSTSLFFSANGFHVVSSRLDIGLLRNEDTGQCVAPAGGWPKEGVELTYSKYCPDKEKFKLELIKLGMHILPTF